MIRTAPTVSFTTVCEIPALHEFTVVKGVKARNCVSDAYAKMEGYDSRNLAPVTLANVSLDVMTQASNQDTNAFLDNSNITPAGTSC